MFGDDDNKSLIENIQNLKLNQLNKYADKTVNDLLKDQKIKEDDKIIVVNLVAEIRNINTQISDVNIKFKLILQAIINSYYALRRSEQRSFSLFKNANITGDKLEILANAALSLDRQQIVPHEVKASMDVTNITTLSNADLKIKNVYTTLRNVDTNEKNIFDELLLKLAIINFSDKKTDEKYVKIEQLLILYRDILKAKNTQASNQFAEKIEKTRSINFDPEVVKNPFPFAK